MTQPTKLWYLRQFNLFSEMTPPEMTEIDRITVMKQVPKYENIYLPGDAANTIYLLKKGKVRIVCYSEDGQEAVLDLLGPGDIFGELALLGDDEPRNEFAQAIEDSYICMIDRSLFERLLITKPHLNLKITKFMGLRLKTIENKIQNLLFNDAEGRVFSLLQQMAHDFGEPHPEGVLINIRLTNREIGNLVKASRQTVSECIGKLRKSGKIRALNNRWLLLSQPGNDAAAKHSQQHKGSV